MPAKSPNVAKSRDLLERSDELIVRGCQGHKRSHDMLARGYPVFTARAAGARFWDVDGNEYLDFTAGIAAASTGHSHPKVVQAIADQAARFVHAQQNVYTHNLLEPLAAKLDEITPASIDTFFFANSSDEVL